MAAPRVFISSTFYDLKQVRNNIGDFIKSLGYEPVMHERASVAYTHAAPLENDCYHELASCDIVVCIIGNHFGSKSEDNELSITMNEIQNAIKNKKKVYIFIANDVFTENRTYILNKDSGTFKSAYTDNLKIHEFIAELQSSVKTHVISPFDTTEQIVDILKSQFAGLLQNLLQREASLTESKTAYDLQLSADTIKSVIQEFTDEKNAFFEKFDCSMFSTNLVLRMLKRYIGLEKSAFFAKDINALDEFMHIVGFISTKVDDPANDERKYIKNFNGSTKTIIIKNQLFDENQNIRTLHLKHLVDEVIVYSEEAQADDDNNDLPF